MKLKSDDKNLDDILNMDDDEFDDYIIDECDKMPSDKQKIKNCGKSVETLIEEIKKYHDELAVLAYKYEIPLKNKADFILKLCKNKQHVSELMPLISCFVCKPEYLFEMKNKKINIKNSGRLAEYLALKEATELFEERLKKVSENSAKYNNIIEKIKADNIESSVNISIKTQNLLVKLYRQYISQKEPLIENIEYIYDLVMQSEDRRLILPILIFKFFVQNKSNISKKPVIRDISSLLKEIKYTAIEKDNGKNFDTYGNYISLFIDIVNEFSDICDVSLCMYAFEKNSNLVEWLYMNTNNKDIFHHTVESLVADTYSSIFFESSAFWNSLEDKSYIRFLAKNEEEESYFSDMVREKLKNKDALDYLKSCAKGKSYGSKFVKKYANKFLEENNLEVKDVGDEEYIYFNIEVEMREKGDEVVRKKIVELIK